MFGWRDDTQTKFAPIAAHFAAQATGFVKSIKLVGFLGTTQVSETQMWMRVFREIYYPSTVSLFQQKREYSGLSGTSNPMLPFGGLPVSSGEGLGSLETVSANLPGQWVVLWLLWNTSYASGTQTNGVMIDYYYSGTNSISSYVELDQDPSKSSGYSKSGIKSFKSNALASYSSNGISGHLLGTIAGDGAGTKYYLRDDSSNSIPVLQSIKSVQVNVPTPITTAATFTETSIAQFNDIPTSAIIPIGAQPSNQLPGQSNLFYSYLVLKKGSQNHLIAVDEETKDKLDAHKKNSSALVRPNFATTGGKQIVGSGSNQNYIAPNLIFSATPKAPQYWDVVEMSDNVYIQTEVVDGSLIADIINTTTEGRDTAWIEGYAPVDGSQGALYTAREKYWYVLPKQARASTNGVCICQKTTAPNPLSDFTSPTAPCSAGFHWGKFLKDTASSSRGFDDSQLNGYTQSIGYAAQNAINNELVGTNIQGYIITSSESDSVSRSTQSLQQISFSLRNVLGFEIGSNVGFPQSTNTAIGGNKTTSFGSTDQTGGSSKTETQYTGPPKDWKKAITEATDRLLAGQTVEQLTPARLAKFLAAQVDLGTPLPLLKETVLASILAAKLTALQAQGKTKKVAEAEIKNDPLYQALVLAIQTTKAKPKSQTGSPSGSSGSGESGGGTVSIKISVVRGLPGYGQKTKPTASVVGQPELVQTYEAYGEDGQVVGDTPPRRFVFPFVPREVTYSGIGTQWTEIPRSGNYPIVDWTGFNLLKISFNFDIVDTRYENVSGFGLHYSCEDEITKLRKMAQTPYPVTFLNMDKFMTDEVRWPLLTSGRGIEFVIADFSVTAIQRTGGGGEKAGTVPNQISRATCSMTLQEIPIENVDIVQMPPIRPCKKNCEGDIPTTEEKFKKYLTYTSGS